MESVYLLCHFHKSISDDSSLDFWFSYHTEHIGLLRCEYAFGGTFNPDCGLAIQEFHACTLNCNQQRTMAFKVRLILHFFGVLGVY